MCERPAVGKRRPEEQPSRSPDHDKNDITRHVVALNNKACALFYIHSRAPPTHAPPTLPAPPSRWCF